MSFQHDLFIYTISRTAAGSNQSYSLGRTIRWIQDLSTPLFLPLLFPPVLLFFFFSRVAIPPVDQQMAAFPHQTTAQLQRDWDTFNNTKQKKKKRSFDVFAVRLCLKTYCCFTVEGLLLFHTHTHIWMCLLFHLTTSPISHLGSAPPPWGRTLNYISMTSFFFFFFPFNQLYLWMWRHTRACIDDVYAHFMEGQTDRKQATCFWPPWLSIHINL